MDLDYFEWNAPSSQAFPDRTTIFRPTIRITLRYRDKHLTPLAQIDSGADYCLFPAGFGRPLGLEVPAGKLETTNGIGNKAIVSYFHNVDVIIGERVWSLWAGFSEGIETALLGQHGFFDRFEVSFHYRDRRICLTPYPER